MIPALLCHPGFYKCELFFKIFLHSILLSILTAFAIWIVRRIVRQIFGNAQFSILYALLRIEIEVKAKIMQRVNIKSVSQLMVSFW